MEFTFPEAGLEVNLPGLSHKLGLKLSFQEGFMSQLRKLRYMALFVIRGPA
jgi:hypothetical protein